jgi:hypothetical protein
MKARGTTMSISGAAVAGVHIASNSDGWEFDVLTALCPCYVESMEDVGLPD